MSCFHCFPFNQPASQLLQTLAPREVTSVQFTCAISFRLKDVIQYYCRCENVTGFLPYGQPIPWAPCPCFVVDLHRVPLNDNVHYIFLMNTDEICVMKNAGWFFSQSSGIDALKQATFRSQLIRVRSTGRWLRRAVVIWSTRDSLGNILPWQSQGNTLNVLRIHSI